MDKQKLGKWADLLLDTGKRNNLINFHKTRALFADIVYPDFKTLFNKISQDTSFEIVDPYVNSNNSADDEDVFSERRKADTLSKEEYLSLYSKKIKKSLQILIYNDTNTALNAVKNVRKRAISALEETGVNIAYLAFGFVKWNEATDKDTNYYAPLLLVPVSIENKSPFSSFYLKITDDDVILNPTFAFKLESELSVALPEYNDEDITEYFEKIEQLLKPFNWEVQKNVTLGIFSFLKINMYTDLKTNGDKIAKSKNVSALLGESTDITPESANEQTQNKNEPDNKTGELNSENKKFDLHNVVDADYSQSTAIELAKENVSFVLQGPPGTGKSQTITNIIAESLLNGKKVLFVSEKLAALNVVYDKLSKAGLSDFCLELHSHKANKKDVIADLCHTLRLNKSILSSKAATETEIKQKAEEVLDEYVSELHKKRDVINKSLFEIIEDASAFRNAPSVSFVLKDIEKKGEKYFALTDDALEQFVKYEQSIGYDYRKNPWYGFCKHESTYQENLKVKAEFESLKTLCEKLYEISKELQAEFGMKFNTLKKARYYREALNLLKDTDVLTPSLFNKEAATYTITAVKKLDDVSTEILSIKNNLLSEYDEDIFKLDGELCYKKLTRKYTSFLSRLFKKEYKEIVSDLRLCKKDGKRIDYLQAVVIFEKLFKYQKKLETFSALEKPVARIFGNAYDGINTNWNEVTYELNSICELSDEVNFGNLTQLTKEQFNSSKQALEKLSSRMNRAFDVQAEKVGSLLKNFRANQYNVLSSSFTANIRKCNDCIDNIDKIENWCRFDKLLTKISRLDALDFVNFMIDSNLPVKEFVPVFKKIFYSQWTDCILHQSTLLSELSRVAHDKTVERFCEKDKLQFEINKALINAKLSANRPDLDLVASKSSVAVLLREGEKKRKQKSIRTLIAEIPKLVQTLKPCFLMSPLSVSTFLSPEIEFDLVVFDEASQIFPQDAIGAIYRGKQLIVVGDSMQMPPSNFFNAATENTDFEDDDESDITDFESVLDLCSTTFRQLRLKWHYRSKHEQLISFSNKNFYDGELVTFPSPGVDKDGLGVDYCYVDGTFEHQSRVNKKEAEFVVDLIFKHIEKTPELSLGVVAFSIAQQEIIEKLLYKRRRVEPDKEFFFLKNTEEPFFIKNLETVQGDERDVIIFSVAYGKDLTGKLVHNFGPLNKVGGERRLNVAVTRAKLNVKLVTSMHYNDINLEKTGAVGARMLRDYLEFAEKKNLKINNEPPKAVFGEQSADMEEEICEFIRSNGFIADKKVGYSAIKIDICVKKEENSPYLLAIECDGKDYRAFPCARDRDRLRRDVLRKMGWRYYRIWSVDWFKNKKTEQERLLKVLNLQLAKYSLTKSDNLKNETTNSNKDNVFGLQNLNMRDGIADLPDLSKSRPVFTLQISPEPFEFPKYEYADVLALKKRFKDDYKAFLKAVLETEAPLSEEWFLKRTVRMFGREKVTKAVESDYEKMIKGYENYGILRKNGFLYLLANKGYRLRVPKDEDVPRNVKDISIEELAAGMLELIKHNVTVDKEGMFKTLSAELGFARLTDSSTERFDYALETLKQLLEINENMISLKK